MTTLYHADDFGITRQQAQSLLALSSACGGSGALTSMSALANSPAFMGSAALAAEHVERGGLRMGLHLNLVEGPPCLDAEALPLLAGPRGTFCLDFAGLLRQSLGSGRAQLMREVKSEASAQIGLFLEAFPQTRGSLRLDSHQHTHAIPAVFDAIMDAVQSCGCTLSHLRTPVESLRPHGQSLRGLARLRPVNLAKDALLALLWRRRRASLPADCASSLFCGVVLSGRMQQADSRLLGAFRKLADARSLDLELLFHPISVPVDQCLDPENAPFAAACASAGREAEAAWLRAAGPASSR